MDAIPGSAEAIDAVWLSDALNARHPGVRVASVELAERHEATNAHARLVVRYDRDAGAPERIFCKLLPEDPARRAAIRATGMGLREALFYERLAAKLAMRVPLVHAVRHDDDGDFVLLLEDLTATGSRVPDGTRGFGADAAATALEHLADLHLRFEDPGARRAGAAWVQPPLHDPTYASDMFRHALHHHRARLRDDFAAIATLYLEHADAMHALWQEGPTTVIHGDPHLGNLFDDEGTIGFLDWGIVSTGTPLRDVSYFLTMALDAPVRREHERDLLRHYLAVRRSRGGIAIDFDTAWHAHRLHAAYCVVASCQIVTFPEKISEARRVFSEAFLERASAAVEDLEALAALRERGIAA